MEVANPVSEKSVSIKNPRGITVYLEYQSVCPFVGIGSPRKRVCLPPWTQTGGGATLALGKGVGAPIQTTVKKAWHSVDKN
jgi:hypothetical protein